MREQYGEWTKGRMTGFLTSLLRSGFRKYPPKWKVLSYAYQGKKLNPKTKRTVNMYLCAHCVEEFPAAEVEVDHKVPVVSDKGFTTIEDYVERLFCEERNLQVLCKRCHRIKSNAETAARKEKRNAKKNDVKDK